MKGLEMSKMAFKEACVNVVKDVVIISKAIRFSVFLTFLKRFTFVVVGVVTVVLLITTAILTGFWLNARILNFWLVPIFGVSGIVASFFFAVLAKMGWEE